MVYKSSFESFFNMTSWYGHFKNRVMLSKIVNEASKIINKTPRHQNDQYACQVKQKYLVIVGDVSHPLIGEFHLLQSGRRYTQPHGKISVIYCAQ